MQNTLPTYSLLRQYLNTTDESQQNSAVIAHLASLDYLQQTHPQVASAIAKELKDQRSHLKLIASENFSSFAVQLAMGNWMTDKYAEGNVAHRFYAGCDNVDTVEQIAVDQAKRLFGCDHAYVQPHSGVDANLVAMWSILVQRVQNKEVERLKKKTFDELHAEEHETVRKLMMNQTIMGLSLNSGGHLTHGYKHNLSSKMMRSVPYEVSADTGLLDYKMLTEQVQQVRPLILLAGYSAYPRSINFATMREIADSVDAVLMVDMSHFAGLVAGKVFCGDYNPIPFAHIATTTTHKTLRGPRGGMVLCCEEFRETIDKGCPLVLGGPLPHVLAAKAIALTEANRPAFQTYAHQIVRNALALAAALQKRGAILTTHGTDNHLLIIDLSSYELTGRQAEQALRQAGMTVNRNAIPWDPNGAWYTSGVRIGTPAITTLGMKENEMEEIADCIISLLSATKAIANQKTGQMSKAQYYTDPDVLQNVHQRIEQLLTQFPLYPELPASFELNE